MANRKYDQEITAPTNDDANVSWRLTRAAKLLGIEYPIIQAPFGGLPSQHLAATVSNLGGLGSLGAVTLGSSAIKEAIGEIRSLTQRAFAVNLWVSTSDQKASHISAEAIDQAIQSYESYYAELGIERPSQVEAKSQDFEAQVASAIDARAHVLSFTFGVPPAEILPECRKRGISTIGTATSPDEALVLEEAGLELIVASGCEGGGHRGSFLRSAADSLIGTVSLIPQVVDAVRVPVIAAGGIADGRGIAAALVLGAEGVQIGTAFVPCAGSGASKPYAAALLSKAAKRTGLTDAFTGRLARGLRNRLMDELEDRSSLPLPFPLQHTLTQTYAAPAAQQGNTELMTLWAGQSAGLCRCTDATELMTQLIAGTDAYFSKCVSAAEPRSDARPSIKSRRREEWIRQA
jgi:nitronate monooxygenase